MQTRTHTNQKESAINLRIDTKSLDLIDQAAKSLGKSRSAYMIDLARRAAEEEMLNQTNFFLNDEVWQAFNKILDEEPKENKKLKKLFSKKSPWKNA